MDKLELDARVARLERRVGWLSIAILGFLGLVGAGLLLALTARMEARPSVPPMVTPAPLPPPTPVGR